MTDIDARKVLTVKHETREQWLAAAVTLLQDWVFSPEDIKLPPVRVSVGWPSQGGTRAIGKVIGQCWVKRVSADEVAQLFISPILGEVLEDVLATLVHELIHAVDDCESGHKGDFRKMAKAVGLEGKMTATHAGKTLSHTLFDIVEELGLYPHAPLVFEEVEKERKKKKQSTRQLKIECPNDGYTARTTRKWLDDMGLPTCPCGMEMIES